MFCHAEHINFRTGHNIIIARNIYIYLYLIVLNFYWKIFALFFFFHSMTKKKWQLKNFNIILHVEKKKIKWHLEGSYIHIYYICVHFPFFVIFFFFMDTPYDGFESIENGNKHHKCIYYTFVASFKSILMNDFRWFWFFVTVIFNVLSFSFSIYCTKGTEIKKKNTNA